MSEKVINAHVLENGESPFSVDIAVSGHVLKGDEPLSAGGGNLGPSPYDMLTAALGECTAMTVRWYAIQQKWLLDKVEVKLTHHKEGKQDVFTKSVILYGDMLSEDQRDKLIEISAKCPVQRTLEGTSVFRSLNK